MTAPATDMLGKLVSVYESNRRYADPSGPPWRWLATGYVRAFTVVDGTIALTLEHIAGPGSWEAPTPGDLISLGGDSNLRVSLTAHPETAQLAPGFPKPAKPDELRILSLAVLLHQAFTQRPTSTWDQTTVAERDAWCDVARKAYELLGTRA